MPLYVKASGHGNSSLSGLMIVLCAIGQSIGHAVAGLLIKWRGYVWQTLVCANGVYILALIMFRQTWQGIVAHWDQRPILSRRQVLKTLLMSSCGRSFREFAWVQLPIAC